MSSVLHSCNVKTQICVTRPHCVKADLKPNRVGDCGLGVSEHWQISGCSRGVVESYPYTGLDTSLGLRTFRLPAFRDIRHMKVVRLSALRTGRLYPFPPFLSSEGFRQPKISMTTSGIETATNGLLRSASTNCATTYV